MVTAGVGDSSVPNRELVSEAPNAPPPTVVTSAEAGIAKLEKTAAVSARRTRIRRGNLRIVFTVRYPHPK
jgi:hypothetical protein